jgi:threonine dehydrogenase-like Zn-dependent dehydrogenase
MRWIQAGKLNCEGLLTHRFLLDGYREVFIAAVEKRRQRSIKVAFEMREKRGK